MITEEKLGSANFSKIKKDFLPFLGLKWERTELCTVRI